MRIRKVFESTENYYEKISENDFYDKDFDDGNYSDITNHQESVILYKFPDLLKKN